MTVTTGAATGAAAVFPFGVIDREAEGRGTTSSSESSTLTKSILSLFFGDDNTATAIDDFLSTPTGLTLLLSLQSSASSGDRFFSGEADTGSGTLADDAALFCGEATDALTLGMLSVAGTGATALAAEASGTGAAGFSAASTIDGASSDDHEASPVC